MGWEAMIIVIYTAMAFSLVSVISLAASAPGYRMGLWSYKVGLALVKSAGFLSLCAVIAYITGSLIWRGEFFSYWIAPKLFGFLVSVTVLGLTLFWRYKLASHPYIHDITTDTDDPPLFNAILPLRVGAENQSEYGGDKVATQQHAGYPDLHALVLASQPEIVFPLALRVAKEMGWEIVSAAPESLMMEATDSTSWFGFKDDIVIRLRSLSSGTRVDVRSVSRVGKSDLGTNAARISKFLDKLQQT